MNALAWVVFAYGATSLLALLAFAFDKLRAVRGGRRVPESTLHLIELAGGWPGALLAMQLVRHKRRKPSYWTITLAIAALHLGAWLLVGLGIGG